MRRILKFAVVRRSRALALAIVLASSIAHAASPAIESARATLAEGLPQIAADKLRRLLRQTKLEGDDRRDATRLLGEALLAVGQTDSARATLAPLVMAGDLDARLLDAHALARAGEWEEAQVAYAALAAQPNAPVAARLGEAEAWRALGDHEKALAILEPMLGDKSMPIAVRLRTAGLYVEDQQLAKARQLLSKTKATEPGDKLWARYVEARILLAEQQWPAALAQFQQVLKATSHLSENLLTAATIGASEAIAKLQGLDAADKLLETFIWHHPDSPWLDLVFQRLDQVYAGEKSPTEDELRKWSQRNPPHRAALARFYHARLQAHFNKWEKVLATLEPFPGMYPTHRLLPAVELLRADAFLARDQLDSAVRALEAASRSASTGDQRAEVELRTGLVQFRQHELVLAAASFGRAAERSAKIRDIATYNAALSWMGQGNEQRFAEELARLGDKADTAAMRSALRLEQGLSQAREGIPTAPETLRKFLAVYPNHPRAEEARLALAEVALSRGSFDTAAQWIKIAGEKPHSVDNDDHTAYLAIFLADSKTPRDDGEVIRLGNAFLRDRPKSSLVPEVRMKLGQVYFRQPDYPNAETHFATLARDFSTGGYAETALYLAGQSAMRTLNTGATDRALRYFDLVVERGGALKFHAREQQALIYTRLNKEAEAIALYNLILESKPPAVDAELHASCLIGKGDALVSLGRNDPQRLDVALAVFEQLASDPDATPAWRHQAMYKKGKVFEQLGRPGDTVQVYNEVLDETLKGTAREYFWFYKCGFEAARYFEQRQDWAGAIAVLEKIARLEGPHAADASDRAKQIRVEHFVWD